MAEPLETLVSLYPTVSKCFINACIALSADQCGALKNTFRIWRLEKYHKLDAMAMRIDRLGALNSFMNEKYKLDKYRAMLNDYDRKWNALPIGAMIEGCPPANDIFEKLRKGSAELGVGSIQEIKDKVNRAEHLAYLAASFQTKVKMAERVVEDYIDDLSTYINLLDRICGSL